VVYGIEKLVSWITVRNLQMRVEHWLLTELLVWSTLIQLFVVFACFAIAYLASRPLQERLSAIVTRFRWREKTLHTFAAVARSLALPIIAFLMLWAAIGVATAVGWPHLLLNTSVNLVGAWIVIRLTSGLIQQEAIARVIAIGAFLVAALNLFNLLEPTILFLDGLGFRVGSVYVSTLSLLKGGLTVFALLWLANTGSDLLEQRIQRQRGLTPSFKVLTGKFIRLSLITLAIVFALGSVGIDLTAFAVFTGAVGVGIGFGLQKLVSNLISGVILLLDRSIKPGDVVEVGDSFGWVSALNARYASVTTRDGKEWLIPNEDLITQRVINWSYSSDRLRLPIPFGIAYESDVRRAIALAVDAANQVTRVLSDPPPVCRLMAFGDSSVNLELRVWIRDPTNGIVNVRSEILLNIWDRFHAGGVKFPFPQRDVHIKGDSDVLVRLDRQPSAPMA
jgi:Small-conductance mechanosensitive channel